VKLFSQNSNLYDHDTSTSQTDGRIDRRTDRRTTCHGNTALRVASRGNNDNNNRMAAELAATRKISKYADQPIALETLDSTNESVTHFYLRQRRRLCFYFGLFVCLFVCPSDN